MKPALSPTTTGSLPRLTANASISASTCSSVTTVPITSTRRCTGAGLKKCMPTTRDGRPLATEISVTDSEEVLVASRVSGWVIASSWAKIARLSSSFSGTASTTSSTSLRSSRFVVRRMRSKIAVCSSSVSLPRRTARSVDASRCPRPRSSDSSSRSTPTTDSPLRANTSTIPAPIVPSPTTPTPPVLPSPAGRVDGGVVGHRLPCGGAVRHGGPPGRCPVGGSVADCPRRPAAPATSRRLRDDPRPRPGGAGAVRVAGPGHRRGARHLAGRRRGLRPRGGGPGQGRPPSGGRTRATPDAASGCWPGRASWPAGSASSPSWCTGRTASRSTTRSWRSC